MTANIFISFASKDVKMAMTLCTALENRGYKCWISARDIQPGENFQVAIVQAIRHAKILLLVFTANSNNSEEMTKELALASQQKMIVIPLRVEDVTPSDAFAYEFATRQWIDFFADWEFAIEQLARRIANALRERSAGLETNDASEAMTSLASGTTPTFGQEKAPEVVAPKAPESSKPEPAKPELHVEAKVAPPKPAAEPPKTEPLKADPVKAEAAKPARSVAESSAVEVREEVLAALKPAARPAAPAPSAPGKTEPPKPSPPPAKPPEAKAKALAAAGGEDATPAGGNRKVMILVGVVVLALVGIGLAVPAILRANKPAPAEEVAAPPQAPTVVAAPAAPEPTAVNAVATNAVATNAIATAPGATNATATNAPATPKPRRKVETVKTPKDDIPF